MDEIDGSGGYRAILHFSMMWRLARAWIGAVVLRNGRGRD